MVSLHRELFFLLLIRGTKRAAAKNSGNVTFSWENVVNSGVQYEAHTTISSIRQRYLVSVADRSFHSYILMLSISLGFELVLG